MKIDKKTIDAILKLNDDQLWSVIQILLTRSGYDNLKGIKRPADMSVIRKTLSNLSDSDIERAMELLKKGKANGK
ncbi:MAG: hypothetical protein II980_06265 [Clostridia bacterium]|nr:hypothetical protein [Clostridia bacterium]